MIGQLPRSPNQGADANLDTKRFNQSTLRSEMDSTGRGFAATLSRMQGALIGGGTQSDQKEGADGDLPEQNKNPNEEINQRVGMGLKNLLKKGFWKKKNSSQRTASSLDVTQQGVKRQLSMNINNNGMLKRSPSMKGKDSTILSISVCRLLYQDKIQELLQAAM